MTKAAKTGHIALDRLFQAEASELLLAAEQGAIVHGTKNIRDSGAMLESKFRSIFEKRLPNPFQIGQGYLLDAQAKCTPQIDAMIFNSQESHALMQTNEGALYIPFTSICAIGEIKTSDSQVAKHIRQTHRILKSVGTMREGMMSSAGSCSLDVDSIFSFLLIANSTNNSVTALKSSYKELGSKTITILLDKAIIIAPQINECFEPMPLSYSTPFKGGSPWLYEPDTSIKDHRSGIVLMWLYFSIISHISSLRGISLITKSFAVDVERRYPIKHRDKLENITAW